MESDVCEKDAERELVASVLRGKSEDFGHLVRMHQDKVFCMIMRQVGDYGVSADLTQDVFLRAFRGLGSFRRESSFSTWLMRITLNVTNSYFRSRRFLEGRRTCSIEESEIEKMGQEEGVLEKTLAKQDKDKLHGAIRGMKAIYREVVVLCCLEAKTYEEAAVILQVPRGTICSRMNKAFQMLKAALVEV